jgi:D-inositol-3-phosphate glycosyltransferase
VRHGETGYLLPRSPIFFAQKLDTLLQQPDLLARMRQAARPSVLGYSWTEVARQVRDLYEDALQESRCLAAL